MSEKYKTTEDQPYFLTITLQGWVDLFTKREYSDLIVSSLRFCHLTKGLVIHEFVIMSSHLHLIVQHENADLSAVIRDFKKHTARVIIEALEKSENESRREWILRLFKYYAKNLKQNKTYAVWRKSNRPVVLGNADVYTRCKTYIHENPVKAGLVTEPVSWLHSSACVDNPLADILGKNE